MTAHGTLSRDQIRQLPKVLLHDHLDGGLRPDTLAELSEDMGRPAPTLIGGSHRDLVAYLDAFRHTVAVLQNAENLRRVAREALEDLAADGVVYAEIRFAPELHSGLGRTLDDVIEATLDGLHAGPDTISWGLICTAMRSQARSAEVAEAASRWMHRGVVGFDIAGPEDGYPPARHLEAFNRCQREYLHITIHAGEAFGTASIREALQYCAAERIGHGVRLLDDIPKFEGQRTLGRLANFVRDREIPLEICPTSNIDTGIVDTLADHPIDLLYRLGFRVTVNTDNRLMSRTTLTEEFARLGETFGYGIEEIEALTVNAMHSAFCRFDRRRELLTNTIEPAFSALRSVLDTQLGDDVVEQPRSAETQPVRR